MNDNPLYDEKIIMELLRMQEEEPEAFADWLMGLIKKYPQHVIAEDRNPALKMMTLKQLREHYEREEHYDNCLFIQDLEKKILEKDNKADDET